MEPVSIQSLIKAGFHFGHRTSRWNPKMAPYIFKRRNLIHIIDLRATLRGLLTARKVAQAVAARRQYVLFVGTKKQAAEVIQREAQHCGMPYVAERWPGGLLTNFVTIRQRLDRLAELEELEETGQIELYGKKMLSSLRREKRKILRNLGGVRNMDRLPSLLVVIDPAREHIAVKEARKLAIPVVALTDTDGDPNWLDVVVPGNDDSYGAVEIFLKTVSEAIVAGSAPRAGTPPKAEAEPEAPRAAAPAEPETAPATPTADGAGSPSVPAAAAPEGASTEGDPDAEGPAADGV
ncbi:MAG: 30S ribosomal protein S2 [Candidatus Brocadiaceae bacterium]|nr:30S ribosomal protein S2 [Candidatus Brocadiaceae bacterium]